MHVDGQLGAHRSAEAVTRLLEFAGLSSANSTFRNFYPCPVLTGQVAQPMHCSTILIYVVQKHT